MTPESALFSVALGLPSPWLVDDVQFDAGAKELHLHLGFDRGSHFSCPVCAAGCKACGRSPRVWRHPNFFEHKSFIHADLPRVECPVCGVKVADVPWARSGSGFTLLFEALVLVLCKNMPVSAVARLVKEHDSRLWRVIEHYVDTARDGLDMSDATKIGADETSWKSGHQYVALFTDLDERRVLSVTEGKDAQTVADFRTDPTLHNGKPGRIEPVRMDLSPAFQSGVSKEFPQAKQIFDRFHVAKPANEAVDAIRRLEVKSNGELKKTRYLWLSDPETLSEAKREKLATIQAMNPATATAYQMKLNPRELWSLPNRQAAAAHLDAWYKWASESSIGTAMKKLAKTVKAHATGILAYFPDRLTSGLMEGSTVWFKLPNPKPGDTETLATSKRSFT